MKNSLILGTAVAALIIVTVSAQTRVVPPSNKYSPAQDVQMGKQAAEEARQQLPIMRDDVVTSYVQTLGRRLVDAIPENLRQTEFNYTFEAVNVREINAFALPGGPMFVNRGMIEAATTEGEVAGVMAHEISHVVLRHGTAQASKATKYEVGQMAGAVIGAILGGQVGNVIAQGTQFGLGAAFMRFGRDYERQADIEGAQIMSAAGYDAREMANMFKTIEKQGSNGPEWLSDHPNPGNRADYINKEAASLSVNNPIRNSEGFTRVRQHLSTLPKAPTTEEATKNAKRGGGSTSNTGAKPSGNVAAPSTRYQSYTEGNVFQISVPSNWQELSGSETVTFAPQGAYGAVNGNNVFTHGVQAGLQRKPDHDLQTETDELIDALAKGNPRLSQSSGYQNISLNGRRALQTSLGNISEVNSREETIQLITTLLKNGDLFWVVAVAPREELGLYQNAFQRVLSSIRFKE